MTTNKITLYLIFSFNVLLLNGCPGDVLSSPPLKVEGRPNTFTTRPMTFTRSENVTRVIVIAKNDKIKSHDEIQWEVVAVEPIKAKYFQVTVGRCPKGFKQIIPNNGDSFVPLKGHIYTIEIVTDAANVYPIGTDWIAE